MFIRRLARPLLAAIFISGGIQALRDVPGHAKVAGPFLDKTVGQAKGSLPAEIPTDSETLIQIDSAVKIGAGTMLALGKSPRLAALLLIGSAVPTTLSAHSFWEYEDPEQRSAQQTQFLKNLSLIGGLLIAAVDTRGKPSLTYQAKHSAQRSSKAMRKTAR